jgi:hypothetical protein
MRELAEQEIAMGRVGTNVVLGNKNLGGSGGSAMMRELERERQGRKAQ